MKKISKNRVEKVELSGSAFPLKICSESAVYGTHRLICVSKWRKWKNSSISYLRNKNKNGVITPGVKGIVERGVYKKSIRQKLHFSHSNIQLPLRTQHFALREIFTSESNSTLFPLYLHLFISGRGILHREIIAPINSKTSWQNIFP